MKIINTKIIESDYFNQPGLSTSFLKRFAISPAHAFVYQSETKELEFGTMLHSYILEPDKFFDTYMVTEIEDGRTAEYKELKKQSKAENKILIKQSDIADIEKMRQSFSKKQILNIPAEWILKDAIIEQGIYAEIITPENNIRIKCKPDVVYINNDSIIIIDLKTMAAGKSFYWQAQKYKYDWQMEIYSNIVEAHYGMPVNFIFAVLEKSPPFGCQFYKAYSQYAKENIEKCIEKYVDWVARGEDKTECYNDEIIEINY